MGLATAFLGFMVMTAANVLALTIAVGVGNAFQLGSANVIMAEPALTAPPPFVTSSAVCMVGFVTMVCANFGARIMQATHARTALCWCPAYLSVGMYWPRNHLANIVPPVNPAYYNSLKQLLWCPTTIVSCQAGGHCLAFLTVGIVLLPQRNWPVGSLSNVVTGMETTDFGFATLHVVLIILHVELRWTSPIRLYSAVRRKGMNTAQGMTRLNLGGCGLSWASRISLLSRHNW